MAISNQATSRPSHPNLRCTDLLASSSDQEPGVSVLKAEEMCSGEGKVPEESNAPWHYGSGLCTVSVSRSWVHLYGPRHLKMKYPSPNFRVSYPMCRCVYNLMTGLILSKMTKNITHRRYPSPTRFSRCQHQQLTSSP